MQKNIREHLEHVEHLAHQASDSVLFMGKLATTMAIIAAVIAVVAFLGHREHAAVLRLQSEASQLLTQSAELKVEASNAFLRFQSKVARLEELERAMAFAKLFPLKQGSEDLRDNEIKRWEGYITKNKTTEEDIKMGVDQFPVRNEDGSENDTTGGLVVTGKRFQQLAVERVEAAKAKAAESDVAHHQAVRLDWAHLTVEMGLVLCTFCVITKVRSMWFAGILVSGFGVYLAVTALGMGH